MLSSASVETPAHMAGVPGSVSPGRDELASRIATRVEAIYASSAQEKKMIDSLRQSLRQRDQALADFHKQNSDLRVELSSLLLQQKKMEHEAKSASSFQSTSDNPPPPSSIRSPTELLATTLTAVQRDLWEAKKEIEALHSERAATALDLRRMKDHNTTLAKAVTLAVAESEKSREEASYLSEELKVLRSVRESVARRNQALASSRESPPRALEISDLAMRSLSAVRVFDEVEREKEDKKVEELKAKLEKHQEDKQVAQLKAKLEKGSGGLSENSLVENVMSKIAEKQENAQQRKEDDLVVEMAALRRMVRERDEQVFELKRHIESESETVRELHQIINNLKEQKASLNMKVRESERNETQLRERINAKESEISIMRSGILRMEQEVTRGKTRANNLASSTRRQATALKERALNMKIALADLKGSMLTELSHAKSSLTSSLTRALAMRGTISAEFATKISQVKTSAIREITNEREATRRAQADADTARANASAQLLESTTQLRTAEENVRTLEMQNAKLERENQKLAQKVDATRRALVATEEEAITKREHVADHKRLVACKLEDYEGQCSAYRKSLGEMEKRVQLLREERKKHRAKVETWRTAMDEARSAISVYRLNQKELVNKLKKTKKDLAEEQRFNAALREEAEQMSARLKVARARASDRDIFLSEEDKVQEEDHTEEDEDGANTLRNGLLAGQREKEHEVKATSSSITMAKGAATLAASSDAAAAAEHRIQLALQESSSSSSAPKGRGSQSVAKKVNWRARFLHPELGTEEEREARRRLKAKAMRMAEKVI